MELKLEILVPWKRKQFTFGVLNHWEFSGIFYSFIHPSNDPSSAQVCPPLSSPASSIIVRAHYLLFLQPKWYLLFVLCCFAANKHSPNTFALAVLHQKPEVFPNILITKEPTVGGVFSVMPTVSPKTNGNFRSIMNYDYHNDICQSSGELKSKIFWQNNYCVQSPAEAAVTRMLIAV